MGQARALLAALALAVLLGACSAAASRSDQATRAGPGGNMQISSTAFKDGESIPRQYSCDGASGSPPVTWSGVPAGTQTLALIVEDPDAPSGSFIHWVAFNLPAGSGGLAEGVRSNDAPGGSGVQGMNGARRQGYTGPCPPSGTHRYYFRLYALDTRLPLGAEAMARDVQAAMKDHILAQAETMGRYQRQ